MTTQEIASVTVDVFLEEAFDFDGGLQRWTPKFEMLSAGSMRNLKNGVVVQASHKVQNARVS